MITALYIRVSTEEQAKEGYSINAQKNNLINFCKNKNWNNLRLFVDAGYSGAKPDRPQLQELLKQTLENKIERVVVWKIDRLSRKLGHLLKIFELLEENKVPLISMTENFDLSTPAGKLFTSILGGFAEFERENIIQRVKAVAETRRVKKRLPLGNPPIGYRLKNDRYIQTDEARIVRLIFELYLKGYFLTTILKDLRNRALKPKKSGEFTRYSLNRILKNPTYAGLVWIKGKYEKGAIEPIVSVDEFKKVQEIRKKKQKFPSKRVEKYLLSGILRCGYCGARMVSAASQVSPTRDYKRYYKCSSKSRYYASICPSKMVKAEIVEGEVIKRIMNIIKKNKNLIMEELYKKTREINKNKERLMQRIRCIAREISDVESRITKELRLYEDDVIDKNILKERITALKEIKNARLKEKSEIEKKMNSSQSIEEQKQILETTLDNFSVLWDVAALPEKRKLLLSIVSKVIVYKDKIEVWFTTGYKDTIKIEYKNKYFNRKFNEWEIEALESFNTKKAKAILMLYEDKEMCEVANKLGVDFSKIQTLVRVFNENKVGISVCATDFPPNKEYPFEAFLMKNIEKVKRMTFDEILDFLRKNSYKATYGALKDVWYKHFPHKEIPCRKLSKESTKTSN